MAGHRDRTIRSGASLVAGAALLLASAPSLGAQEPPQRLEDALARVRSATQAFKSLDAAAAAGYERVTGCVDNPPEGAMGYHHRNDALLDDRIEVERPEMLVYERAEDGSYQLNGVEYIVPFSVHPADAEPPVVMGQALKPAPRLGIWYRHVWVWLDNPSGVFADWNPRVACREGTPRAPNPGRGGLGLTGSRPTARP
jgi:hypothetical protein